MNSRLPIFGLVAIMAIMTLVTANLNWGGQYWKTVVGADAKGYFAYLPATFIYHDYNYGFYDTVEVPSTEPHFLYDYRVTVNGKKTNKYYAGTALCQLPFFLAAHGYCLISDHLANGYSKPYTVSVTIAGLFYLFIGLLLLLKTLRTLELKPWAILAVLASITFGTNLFYYAVIEPGMSHIYSFAMMSVFVYLIRKLLAEWNSKRVLLAGLVLGIIILIRPINALVLASVPFLASKKETLFLAGRNLIAKPSQLIIGSMAVLAVVSIQLFHNYVSIGNAFVYTYVNEGFNFFDPHIIDILFSYKKGLFLYTPLFLVMIISSFWVYRKKSFRLISYLLFFVAITYVLSSWWNWWYGGSFSSRVYVEFIPILVVPFALVLNSLKTPMQKGLISTLLVAIVMLCQFQTYQYRYYLLHWEDTTKQMYWDNFLRLPEKQPRSDNHL